jgi:hypothetical protein
MAAASDSIVVVTSRAWLLRYDFSQGTGPGRRFCPLAWNRRLDVGWAWVSAYPQTHTCAHAHAHTHTEREGEGEEGKGGNTEVIQESGVGGAIPEREFRLGV